jgi:hypothetical protein
MSKLFSLFLILFYGLFCQTSYTYHGTIIDAETKETLAGVNIYIDGTSEGTATDGNGNFDFITFKEKPIVNVAYVGYRTRKIKLENNIKITMSIESYQSDAVTVYAKGYSRAQQIVLNCMENYNENLKRLSGFKLNVYSKTFFYFPKTKEDIHEDDSLRLIGKEDEIQNRYPVLFESYKDVAWEKPNKLFQEVVKRNQGKQVPAMFNFFGIIQFENVFNEQYSNGKSPLNMKNFEDFNYSYNGKTQLNKDSVYTIYASLPDTTDSKIYRLLIDDQNYRLKQVSIGYKPKANSNEAVQVTSFIRMRDVKSLTIQQDYTEFSGFTLPRNFILNRVNEKGTARLVELYENHVVNPINLEVRFSNNIFNLSDEADDFDSTYWASVRTEELTPLEVKSFASGDSVYNTFTPWQRFMFDHGLKFLFFDYKIGKYKMTGASDIYHFSPVEGHAFGLGVESPRDWKTKGSLKLNYAEALKKFNGVLSLSYPLSYDYDISLLFSAFHKVDAIDNRNSNSVFNNTLYAVFGHNSAQNYYLNRGFELGLEKQITTDFSLGLAFKNRDILSLENRSEFSITSPDEIYKKNLIFSNSTEKEIKFNVIYKEMYNFDLGAFKFSQLKPNGWLIDFNTVFNFNDPSNIKFKQIELNIFKQNRVHPNLDINFISNNFFMGRRDSLQNSYFPRVDDVFGGYQEFTLSGFRHYDIIAYDFYSVGAIVRVRKLFDKVWKKLGVLTVSSMMYTGKNYASDSQLLNNIHLLNNGIYYNSSISLENDILFAPFKYSYSYNSYNSSWTAKMTFVQGF